jgi:hypothetical protein
MRHDEVQFGLAASTSLGHPIMSSDVSKLVWINSIQSFEMLNHTFSLVILPPDANKSQIPRKYEGVLSRSSFLIMLLEYCLFLKCFGSTTILNSMFVPSTSQTIKEEEHLPKAIGKYFSIRSHRKDAAKKGQLVST